MACILHKLWSSCLFFVESVSFPPFRLRFPWIFQNDQVLGNPFHVACFIFKGGRGICAVEKPTPNVKSFPNFFTGSSHFQMSFHDWHFEEHHVWSSSQKTRVWLKELAWKAQFVSLFPQNKIAHLVCSLPPFRTGWHCGRRGGGLQLLSSEVPVGLPVSLGLTWVKSTFLPRFVLASPACAWPSRPFHH